MLDRPERNGRSRREPLPIASAPSGALQVRKEPRGIKRIFPYGVNRNRLDRAILESHVQATVARDISEADVVLALKASFRREPARMREGSNKNLPTFIVKSNTFAQIAAAVKDIFQAGPLERGYSDDAVREAEQGVQTALVTSAPVDLAPQNSYVRRLQHQIAERSDLVSESVGDEPRRRVRIFPTA